MRPPPASLYDRMHAWQIEMTEINAVLFTPQLSSIVNTGLGLEKKKGIFIWLKSCKPLGLCNPGLGLRQEQAQQHWESSGLEIAQSKDTALQNQEWKEKSRASFLATEERRHDRSDRWHDTGVQTCTVYWRWRLLLTFGHNWQLEKKRVKERKRGSRALFRFICPSSSWSLIFDTLGDPWLQKAWEPLDHTIRAPRAKFSKSFSI